VRDGLETFPGIYYSCGGVGVGVGWEDDGWKTGDYIDLIYLPHLTLVTAPSVSKYKMF
jgi:hypothetical protein